VRAAAVQVSPGQYRLQLTGTTTGSGSTFTVNGLNGLGGTTVVADAQDASIHVGSATQGFDVTSSSNTFTGVSPGLTFTVSQPGVTSTVTVGNDEKSIGSAVSALVDAANAVLADISSQTAAGTMSSDGKTRTGQGALSNDTTVKNLTSSVLQAVTSAIGGVSAAKYGIQSKSDGTLTFDADAFAAAYAADPAGTQAIIAPVGGTGVAQRLAAVANQAADPVTGTITTSIASQTSTVTQLNNQISDWDVRLAARQQTLQNQFNAMEVALQKLQSQSSWLSSQLAGMSSSSSSKSSS
jgi:flagellar hook-associated protein 2